MVKNKKGWLRIIESTISVLIILSAFMLLYQSQKAEIIQEPANQISPVVDLIARNDTLRNKILNNSANIDLEIKNIIDGNINLNQINYTLKICYVNETCNPDLISLDVKKNVYSSDKIISTNLTMNDLSYAKIIRIFYWEIN